MSQRTSTQRVSNALGEAIAWFIALAMRPWRREILEAAGIRHGSRQ